MTHSYAACGTIDHQVLGQDTGEISPGKGEDWRREVGYLGGEEGTGDAGEKEADRGGLWEEFRFKLGVAYGDGGGGLISRLYLHFFLGFSSRGWPISLPRSFRPGKKKKGKKRHPKRM